MSSELCATELKTDPSRSGRRFQLVLVNVIHDTNPSGLPELMRVLGIFWLLFMATYLFELVELSEIPDAGKRCWSYVTEIDLLTRSLCLPPRLHFRNQ